MQCTMYNVVLHTYACNVQCTHWGTMYTLGCEHNVLHTYPCNVQCCPATYACNVQCTMLSCTHTHAMYNVQCCPATYACNVQCCPATYACNVQCCPATYACNVQCCPATYACYVQRCPATYACNVQCTHWGTMYTLGCEHVVLQHTHAMYNVHRLELIDVAEKCECVKGQNIAKIIDDVNKSWRESSFVSGLGN